MLGNLGNEEIMVTATRRALVYDNATGRKDLDMSIEREKALGKGSFSNVTGSSALDQIKKVQSDIIGVDKKLAYSMKLIGIHKANIGSYDRQLTDCKRSKCDSLIQSKAVETSKLNAENTKAIGFQNQIKTLKALLPALESQLRVDQENEQKETEILAAQGKTRESVSAETKATINQGNTKLFLIAGGVVVAGVLGFMLIRK